MARLQKDEFEKGLEIFYPNFLEGYRERVNTYYKNDYEENPENFPLMNSCLLKSFFLKSEPLFLFFESGADKLTNIDISNEEADFFNEFISAPEHVYKEKVYEHFNIDPSEIVKEVHFYNLHGYTTLSFRSNNHSQALPGQSHTSGGNEADNDYLALGLSNAIRKVTTHSTSFPLFDTDLIINTVNDSNFEYEFQESVKAYNSELYLASVVTAAVSLETLLKSAVESKLDNSSLPKDNREKHTLNYAKILLKNDLITERLEHRIRSLNELRRSGSHSKTGEIEQWDAEQMISGIKIVVESIFDENT